MSYKQGKAYNRPDSKVHIRPFIDFHQIDMSESLLPIEDFPNFNEFFYRALKPGSRPIFEQVLFFLFIYLEISFFLDFSLIFHSFFNSKFES